MKLAAATHPFFAGLAAPLHISHRGGARVFPENTLFAFQQAQRRYGTQVIELDLHATKDGQLVVSHDPAVDRCTDGTGHIAELTWGELRSLDAAFRLIPEGESQPTFRGKGIGIPRFVDVLRAMPSMRFNVELKADAAFEPFLALVREEQCLGRLCLGSEHDALATRLSDTLPDALHFFPANALAGFIFAIKGGDAPEDDGRYSVLDMPWAWEGMKVVDETLVRVAKAHGKWINVWTVDEAPAMREAIALGVGGIMTDRPDTLRQVLDERRSP